MIVMLLMWTLLFVTSWVSGVTLLSAFSVMTDDGEPPDTWWAIWCGLLANSLAALGLSLLGPVTAILGCTTWGIVALLSITSVRVRRGLRHTGNQLVSNARWWPAVIAIAAVTGLYCAQAPCNYDTLLYHHQAIKWLAQHGATQGLVLLHHRLGFVSAWFALAAPFENAMPLRSATVLNGFTLLLAIVQMYFSSIRVFSGRARLADFLAIFGLGAVLGLHLLSLDPASAAPDFAVSVMTVVLATWVVQVPGSERPASLRPALLLAVMLPAIKLSAFPLAAIVSFWYLVMKVRDETIKKRIVVLGLLYLFVMAPVASVSWRLTGALLFPSGLLAMDVPWGLGAEKTRAIADAIKAWARWNGPAPPGANPWDWLIPWLSSSKGTLFFAAAAGNLAAVGWAAFQAIRKSADSSAHWCVPALGMCGTVYLAISAPNPRFGFGMLVLGWCWIASMVLLRTQRRSLRNVPQSRWTRFLNVGLVLLVTLGMVGLMLRPVDTWRTALNATLGLPLLSATDGRMNWFRPAKVPSIGYERRPGGGAVSAFRIDLRSERLNNFRYSFPANTDICGPAPLPAAPHRVNGIELASPNRGLGGGFVRVTEGVTESNDLTGDAPVPR